MPRQSETAESLEHLVGAGSTRHPLSSSFASFRQVSESLLRRIFDLECRERSVRPDTLSNQMKTTGRCQMMSTTQPFALSTRWVCPGSLTTNVPAP